MLGLELLADSLQYEQRQVALVRILTSERHNFLDGVHPASTDCVERNEGDTHAETVDDDALAQLHSPRLGCTTLRRDSD